MVELDLDALPDGVFHVWQPNSVSLLKAQPDATEDKKWRIGGYASTEDIDRQGESVLQRGLDFSEFVQYGYYNDNHQQHTSAVVGVPELATHQSAGWWTEGYLLRNVPRAVEIYQLAKSLAVESPERKLGFSIEGKILERSSNKIIRALVRNVAITNSPVNVNCSWDLIQKSWATADEKKALAIGHARVPESGGRVLVPEDLEKDELKYVYICPTCRKSFSSAVGVDLHAKKHGKLDQPVIRRSARLLNKSDAFEYFHRIRPDYSPTVIGRLVAYIFDQNKEV